MTNPKFATLRRNLQGSGNAARSPNMQSWARTCDHSCRGNGGSMHAKYYIFSRSGKSKHIVMNSSANLTAASASVQWNDLYTTVDRKRIYKQYMRVFKESVRDKAAPYVRFQDKEIVGFFFPLGKQPHPAMQMLDKVRCHGAERAGTRDGRTIIRVAQDVFNDRIGLNIALKLRQLHRRGCDVKVVYSQAVGASKSVIKSMPNNHLVQDRDGDCAYDRYLHSKVLSISGRYGDKRGERIVLNGSGNWSGTAVRSDEQGMIINKGSVERTYGAWINAIFRIHLVSAPCDPDLADDGDEEQRMVNGKIKIDRYANMEG